MEYSRTKVMRRLLKGIVLPLLLLAWLAFSLPVLAVGVTVSVDAPAQVTVGNDFTARVNIANVTNLDAFVFRVRFDPSIIDLPTTDADSDTIYDSIVNGVVGGKKVRILTTVWKEPGLIGIVGEVEPFLSGTTGSGYLAELHFRALSPGNSNIGLDQHSLSNATAETLTAEWVGSSVTVYAGPVPPKVTEPKVTPKQVKPDGPVSTGAETTVSQPAGSGAETPVTPYPTISGTSWPLIGGISGAAVVLIVIVILIVRRRRD